MPMFPYSSGSDSDDERMSFENAVVPGTAAFDRQRVQLVGLLKPEVMVTLPLSPEHALACAEGRSKTAVVQFVVETTEGSYAVRLLLCFQRSVGQKGSSSTCLQESAERASDLMSHASLNDNEVHLLFGGAMSPPGDHKQCFQGSIVGSMEGRQLQHAELGPTKPHGAHGDVGHAVGTRAAQRGDHRSRRRIAAEAVQAVWHCPQPGVSRGVPRACYAKRGYATSTLHEGDKHE
jgi:hypothetical protein